MKIGDSKSQARQQQRNKTQRRSTPQERDGEFKREVEDVKGRIRAQLDRGHVMLPAECRDAARRDGDFAAVQAITEISSEMRERNRENGGGSRRWMDQAVKEASRADAERRQRSADREVQRIVHEARRGASGIGGGLAAANDASSEEHNPGARFPTKGRRKRARTPIGPINSGAGL